MRSLDNRKLLFVCVTTIKLIDLHSCVRAPLAFEQFRADLGALAPAHAEANQLLLGRFPIPTVPAVEDNVVGEEEEQYDSYCQAEHLLDVPVAGIGDTGEFDFAPDDLGDQCLKNEGAYGSNYCVLQLSS